MSVKEIVVYPEMDLNADEKEHTHKSYQIHDDTISEISTTDVNHINVDTDIDEEFAKDDDDVFSNPNPFKRRFSQVSPVDHDIHKRQMLEYCRRTEQPLNVNSFPNYTFVSAEYLQNKRNNYTYADDVESNILDRAGITDYNYCEDTLSVVYDDSQSGFCDSNTDSISNVFDDDNTSSYIGYGMN